MVNWKLLGISALAYLGSYGLDYGVLNTRKGYDSLEYGLKQGDNAIVQYVLPSAGPGIDLIQKATGIRLGWDEPYLQNNDYNLFQLGHDAAGVAQVGSAIAGLLALAGVRSRKKSKKVK